MSSPTPSATDRDPLSRIGWDLSPFDARAHAVDPLDQQLTGVYVALCGARTHSHGVQILHGEPQGLLCTRCVVANQADSPHRADTPAQESTNGTDPESDRMAYHDNTDSAR